MPDAIPIPREGDRLRAIVFVDYQNMYRGAREAFGWTDESGHIGNFRPHSLGRALTRADDRQLVGVRVYSGVPSPQRDRRGHGIMQRRIATWVGDEPAIVQVFPRSLSYPPSEGREKGVDVELAIDLAQLAVDDEYDIGILASADSDLVPALQFVNRRYPGKTLETVTWEPKPGCERDTAAAIDIPGGGVTRRTLSQRQMTRISERRNFVTMKDDPASVAGKDRWNRINQRLDRPGR
jgi:uncharacterized LabA/DUF88 family protein